MSNDTDRVGHFPASYVENLKAALRSASCPDPRCSGGSIINTGPDPQDDPCEWCYGRHLLLEEWERSSENPANYPAPSLVDAVALAAKTFRHYEHLHREKGTPDGERKAHGNAVLAEQMEAALGSASNVPCHGPWGDLIADAYWFADSYVCGLIDSESTYEDDGWRQMDPDDLHSEWHYAERRGLIEHDPGHRGRFRFTPGREFLGPGVAPNNGGAARPVSREGVAEETPKRIDADSRTEIGDLGDKAESEARAQTRSATSEKGGTDHLGQPSGANTSIVERVANPVAPTLQAAIDELLMGVPTPGMESGGPRNWIVDAVGVLRAARKRLELDGTPYDGIATRDETIRLQDERIKALESPPVGRSPQNGNPMNLTIWTGIREYIAAEIALADARRELNEASTDEEIGDRTAVVRRLEEQSTRMETSVREAL